MSLDYTVEENDGEFSVWTPDTCGAIIGVGGTKEAALADARVSLLDTAAKIFTELP